MIGFKGYRVEKDIILTCVRWYLAYPLGYRSLGKMMAERGQQRGPGGTQGGDRCDD
jgi:transposase-like protein